VTQPDLHPTCFPVVVVFEAEICQYLILDAEADTYETRLSSTRSSLYSGSATSLLSTALMPTSAAASARESMKRYMSFTVVVPDFMAVMYEYKAAVRAVSGLSARIEGYHISSR